MKRKNFKAAMGIMAGVLTLGTSAMAAEYPDVNPGDWYYGYVQYASDKGLMTGYDNGNFGPGDNLTRGQFATILYRMSGSPEVEYTAQYPDVSDGWFYSDAVTWAKGTGVITGYDNGNFGPNDNITREQMATILYRNDGSPAVGGNGLGEFPDGGQVSAFARDGVLWAVQNQIITGDKGYIVPQGNAVRAHCATILQRYLERAVPEQPSNPQQPSEPQKPDKPQHGSPEPEPDWEAIEEDKKLREHLDKNGWDIVQLDDYIYEYFKVVNGIQYQCHWRSDGCQEISVIDGSNASGKVEIPSSIDGIGVTAIVDNVFEFNDKITEVVIPASVTSMPGAYTFSFCDNLKVLRFCGDKPEDWYGDANWSGTWNGSQILHDKMIYYPKNASGWDNKDLNDYLDSIGVQVIPY